MQDTENLTSYQIQRWSLYASSHGALEKTSFALMNASCKGQQERKAFVGDGQGVQCSVMLCRHMRKDAEASTPAVGIC